MPLTDVERMSVREKLGYPAVTSTASIQFGVPALSQTNFLVENNTTKLLESALPRVRSILQKMDDIEQKLTDAQDRLAATALEDLKLRDNEPDLLEAEYRRWGYRLSDIVGAPIYPYSRRYMGGSNSIRNVSVM